MIGGDHDGKIVKAAQLKPSLSTVPAPRFFSIQEQEQFRITLPKVFEALLSTESGEGYIDGVGGIDYENLAQAGVDLAATDGDKKIVIRTVFGATELMPLRALSYIIPGLIYTENIKRLTGSELQLQFIFATNITSTLNGIAQEVARDQAVKLARVARAYIAEFFPDIQKAVFLQDVSLDHRLKQKLEELAESVRIHATPEMVNKLSEKGENHNGQGRHELYGGAHILIHDAASLDILEPILPNQPEVVDPSVIVSMGGKQESDFYKLRHQVKPFVDESYRRVKTIQYFTKHHVPPYYMDRNGDISLDNGLNVSSGFPHSIGKSASFDIDYLRSVSDRRKDFLSFLRKVSPRYE